MDYVMIDAFAQPIANAIENVTGTATPTEEPIATEPIETAEIPAETT